MKKKMRSAMSEEFMDAYARQCHWLCFIGQPMVYDGALFVTR
jgi:hypothetical protein